MNGRITMASVQKLKEFLQNVPDDWEVSLTCEDDLIVFVGDDSERDSKPSASEKTFKLLV
jgi:hypothetical protein